MDNQLHPPQVLSLRQAHTDGDCLPRAAGVIISFAATFGYTVLRERNPFEGTTNEATAVDDGNAIPKNQKLPPPPENLHDICSDWITAAGSEKCKTECDVEL